ncbi:hypothetical protein [Poriferisphaera sp. WC338]|uniref:hypothetical protein n=1 Tax=Poriferisphaera sp. WC338 TaxID=3425129 RepID=UPI003D818FD2
MNFQSAIITNRNINKHASIFIRMLPSTDYWILLLVNKLTEPDHLTTPLSITVF